MNSLPLLRSRAARPGLALLLFATSCFLTALPLHAAESDGIEVDAPAVTSPGTIVNSPFYVQAEAPTCNSATTTSFGYSINSGGTTYVSGTTIQTMLTLSAGSYTLHFKSYNGTGYECDYDVPFTVGGGVGVSAPGLSATLPETFNLVASAPTCGGQSTTGMDYNVDSQSGPSAFDSTSLNMLVDSEVTSGAHILRVKAWGGGSIYCETDIPFSVTGGIAAASGANLYTGTSSSYPYSGLESLPRYVGNYGACPPGSAGTGSTGATQTPYVGYWQTQPDCGTVGNKTNVTTTYPSTAELNGWNADSWALGFTYSETGGGVRWFNQLPDNSNADAATHFLYDAYVYIAPGSNVGQIEMDINHASPENDLYLMAMQCNIVNGTWDVTVYGQNWVHTSNPCRNVTTGAWHHLQVLYHHDANPGTTIYYDEASLDGNVQTLSCPTLSDGCESTMQTTSWARSVGPNFQLDGGGSNGSSITAYVDNLTVWYW